MTFYLTESDVTTERMQALLAEDRARYENTCCASCRRGPKGLLTNPPCGRNQDCRCHKETNR